MMCMNILSEMQLEMRTVLEDNILSFWEDKMTDSVHGGFYGRITGTGKLEPQAVKGAVLNARILWTFSSLTACWGKPNIWRQPLVPNVSLLINSTTRNRVEYIGRSTMQVVLQIPRNKFMP